MSRCTSAGSTSNTTRSGSRRSGNTWPSSRPRSPSGSPRTIGFDCRFISTWSGGHRSCRWCFWRSRFWCSGSSLGWISRSRIYLQNDTEPRGGRGPGGAIRHRDPLPVQYVAWLGGVLRGDLGWSGVSVANVSDVLPAKLLATLELATSGGWSRSPWELASGPCRRTKQPIR